MFLKNDRSTYKLRKALADQLGEALRDISSVEIVNGDSPPALHGERKSFHHETRGGRLISHPSAYSKKGWSNIVYVGASYYHATVGAAWIIQNLPGKLEEITFGPARRKVRA